MKKTLIYQSYTKPLPNDLKSCLNSVKRFVNENKFEYNFEEFILGKFKFFSSASDRIRIKKLSERPYVLWIDWDIVLHKNFDLPDDLDQPMRANDCMMWNGLNTEIFSKALNVFDEYNEKYKPFCYDEHYRMYKCLKRVGYLSIPEFDKNTYEHFNWSRIKNHK